MQRFRVIGVIIGVGVALLLVWRFRPESAPSSVTPGAATPVAASTQSAAPASAANPPRAAALAALNAPEFTIHDDERLLQDLFVSWQTNFPATGNPVGTNAEITEALCGDNALKLDLIPRDHPAINPRGELCDRWGTPFRFHQVSGTEMQIISAGPDRDFATADDVAAP